VATARAKLKWAKLKSLGALRIIVTSLVITHLVNFGNQNVSNEKLHPAQINKKVFRNQLYSLLESIVSEPPDINVEQTLNVCLNRGERPVIIQMSNITVNNAVMNIVQVLKELDHFPGYSPDYVKMLKDDGWKASEIAEKLSISTRHVYRLLQTVNNKRNRKNHT